LIDNLGPILNRKNTSFPQLRKPEQSPDKVGSNPVATRNCNQAIANLNCADVVPNISTAPLGKEKLRDYLEKDLPKIAHVIDYLKDK